MIFTVLYLVMSLRLYICVCIHCNGLYLISLQWAHDMIFLYKEMLTCVLRAQDKNLKIEWNNKYCIENINFFFGQSKMELIY